MTTTARFHSYNPAAATLLGHGVQTNRNTRTAPAVHQPALWQQSLWGNEGHSLIERLACLLLILFAVAAMVYGALVMARTFQGDHFQQAVARIAHHDAR